MPQKETSTTLYFRSRLSENPSTDFRLVSFSGKKTKRRIRNTMVVDDPMYHSLTVLHDLLSLENAVTKNSQFISVDKKHLTHFTKTHLTKTTY